MTGTVEIPVALAPFTPSLCLRHAWLVLLHARRVPPHVGLMINGNYNSLTVKGVETNITLEVLLKTIQQKKIESVFLKIVEHPVFSLNYQLETFQELLKNYSAVKQFENTCLSPVKEFFQEFYAVKTDRDELLPGFLLQLQENGYLDHAAQVNVDPAATGLVVPLYSQEELQQRITDERLPFYAK